MDKIAVTNPVEPGATPDLLAVLWGAFAAAMGRTLQKRDGVARTPDQAVAAAQRQAAPVFVAFARDYLAKHRPGETFAADRNVGLVLANHQRCLVAPGAAPAGEMQGGGSVSVTGERSQPGLGGAYEAKDTFGVF